MRNLPIILGIITLLAAANNFTAGVKLSIASEKIREARLVYFDYILDNVLS